MSFCSAYSHGIFPREYFLQYFVDYDITQWVCWIWSLSRGYPKKSPSELFPCRSFSDKSSPMESFPDYPPTNDHLRCYSIKSQRVSIISCWMPYFLILIKPQLFSMECCSMSILRASSSCCFIIWDAAFLSLRESQWYYVEVYYLLILRKSQLSSVECCSLSIHRASSSCYFIIWDGTLLSLRESRWYCVEVSYMLITKSLNYIMWSVVLSILRASPSCFFIIWDVSTLSLRESQLYLHGKISPLILRGYPIVNHIGYFTSFAIGFSIFSLLFFLLDDSLLNLKKPFDMAKLRVCSVNSHGTFLNDT